MAIVLSFKFKLGNIKINIHLVVLRIEITYNKTTQGDKWLRSKKAQHFHET